ncbi:hypothetical protein V8D89_000372 [Ganoderma adspersum]
MDSTPSYLRIDQPIPPRLAGVSGNETSPRSSSFPDDGIVMGVLTASRGGSSPTSAGGARTLPVPPVTRTARHAPTMVSRTFALTLAFALFAASTAPTAAAAASISLTTTTITECVQTMLTWSGGNAPYKLKISPLKADNNSDTSQLQQYSNISTASFGWTANFTVGTRVQFDITDANGDASGDPPLTVGAGPNANCLPAVSGSSSGSATTTGTGGSPGSTASGSLSPNNSSGSVSRTGLSAGAIAGIAVGVGVMAVLATTITVWCLLKRLLFKHRRHRHRSRSGTDTPSSSSSADEVRASWYRRAARRMSLRGHGFDIDRPVARSPTFSDRDARSATTAQRGPLLPVSAYHGISSTLEGTGAAVDPFRVPTPTDSVIVSGPSSPVSDRGEASFRQTPSYSAPSHLQHSTTSLSDTQSQTKKPRRPAAHAHNTSDTSTRSGATATSTTELRPRTANSALSTQGEQAGPRYEHACEHDLHYEESENAEVTETRDGRGHTPTRRPDRVGG